MNTVSQKTSKIVLSELVLYITRPIHCCPSFHGVRYATTSSTGGSAAHGCSWPEPNKP